MSLKYCLLVPIFHFWPKLTHPAAWSLCDSWATCNCRLCLSVWKLKTLLIRHWCNVVKYKSTRSYCSFRYFCQRLIWHVSVFFLVPGCTLTFYLTLPAVAALHQGAPDQVTWLEDPPPCLLLCFASIIVWTEHKNFTISDRWPFYLFYFDSETISAALAAFVFWGRRLKRLSTLLGIKVHSGDLARGCSDLEMTWLLCCAVAAVNALRYFVHYQW